MVIGKISIYFILIFAILSCKGDLEDISYEPQDYVVEGVENLGIFPNPKDNPTTLDGVKLGQHLFYDPILSGNGTMSCASCHDPQLAFTDGRAKSIGIDGIPGKRSAMSLINSAYNTNGLFWDGRTKTLEEQALLPVTDPVELHHTWPEVIEDLKKSELYRPLFRKAFGIEDSDEITKELAAKALAQFQRILISANSPYDKWKAGKGAISDEAANGELTFFDIDPLRTDGECGHCHNEPLFTANEYFDNGIQKGAENGDYKDKGLGAHTNKATDLGKMRAPTLRNIALTAPYMHDGRFQTLEEVIEHYDSGGHGSKNQDVLILNLKLTDDQKLELVEFMKALTDTSYLENPLVKNPFK